LSTYSHCPNPNPTTNPIPNPQLQIGQLLQSSFVSVGSVPQFCYKQKSQQTSTSLVATISSLAVSRLSMPLIETSVCSVLVPPQLRPCSVTVDGRYFESMIVTRKQLNQLQSSDNSPISWSDYLPSHDGIAPRSESVTQRPPAKRHNHGRQHF